MFEDLAQLVARLKENPEILGVVRFGGRTLDNMSLGGDFDLAVFVKERPEDLASIHFYCREIPVDVLLRTFEDLDRGALDYADRWFSEGEILLDRGQQLGKKLREFTDRWLSSRVWRREHAVNSYRYEQTHILEKVRGRLGDDPLLCEYLLAANIRALLYTYFGVRSRPFPGPRAAFELLQTEDPEIYARIRDFYSSQSLEEKFRVTEELTELVLSPIGGIWRKTELLPLGTRADAHNLQRKGEDVFQMLFGLPWRDDLQRR